MKQPRKRRWARWVMMTLEHDCISLCLMAREEDLAIISGSRPGLCCWNALALYGTSAAVRALEGRWTALKLNWSRRRPAAAWPAVQLVREKWAENTVNWAERQQEEAEAQARRQAARQKEQADEQARRLAARAAAGPGDDPDRRGRVTRDHRTPQEAER